jgi:hypothetical protein
MDNDNNGDDGNKYEYHNALLLPLGDAKKVLARVELLLYATLHRNDNNG